MSATSFCAWMRSATMRLVTAAKVIPRCPWPNARIRFWLRRARPIIGSESGRDGRKPNHRAWTRSKIWQQFADASFEKGNPIWVCRREEAAEFDQSRDPQSAVHRRDIKAEIDRTNRSLD